MQETEITIIVNRKSDIDLVKQILIGKSIQVPIYVFEYESYFRLELTSEYEEWEVDSTILSELPEYEFVSDRDRGSKEIRLQVSRYQSGISMYAETASNQTKYLVKRSPARVEIVNPEVKVLFGASEQSYFINIVGGINKQSGEKGFLLVDEFKKEGRHGETLKDRLYKTQSEALQFGYYKMQKIVNSDFSDYVNSRKKEIKDQQKVPRKIIRDFITACNKFQIAEITRLVDPNIVFGKIGDWEGKSWVDSLKGFEEYLSSSSQELCSKDFKIDTWNFNSDNVTIRLKYYPAVSDNSISVKRWSKYIQLRFKLNVDKIIYIAIDNLY